jgi:hypothetical protein
VAGRSIEDPTILNAASLRTPAHDLYPGIDEVLAVVRPTSARGAATAERIGMEWVGETDKYYDLQLQVYRVRAADLDRPLADQQYGADQH